MFFCKASIRTRACEARSFQFCGDNDKGNSDSWPQVIAKFTSEAHSGCADAILRS